MLKRFRQSRKFKAFRYWININGKIHRETDRQTDSLQRFNVSFKTAT